MHVQRRGPVAHVEVQACFDCKGLWVDCGKLDELDENVWVNSEDFDFDLFESEERLLCPVCQEPLDLLGVPYDVDATVFRCPSCLGFWLHESDLEGVQLAAHRAMVPLEDMVVVGPSDKNHPNIVAKAKQTYTAGRVEGLVDDFVDWLRRNVKRRR